MIYKVDAAVVGAGVVGLACAVQFARHGLQTVLLEREGKIGQGISSRNSEVIHAGLINLFGIESPGLTSCLAIADEVMARFGLDELEDEK